ncbi:MAG: E3 ubiquitin ligase family protein [Nanoarchaeota archaeon]|nr:E3 ubiquitin ligase family protein [Nanoarchaeota archaeon]
MIMKDIIWMSIWTLAFFVTGVFLFWNGIKLLKQKRLIENIPTSKIRSLAMGLVEIYGEVVPAYKEILKSPFSNKDCVYYSYTIEEYRSSGKSSHWVTVENGHNEQPFYLKDDTGGVLIDSKGANINVLRDFEFNTGFGKKTPDLVLNFLKSKGMNHKTLFGFGKTMRYKEHFIAPKDKLYIMGTASDNPFVEDGTAKNNVEDIIIQKGKNEKMYYISDKQENALLKEIKWKMLGFIFGGALLSVVCLQYLRKQLISE